MKCACLKMVFCCVIFSHAQKYFVLEVFSHSTTCRFPQTILYLCARIYTAILYIRFLMLEITRRRKMLIVFAGSAFDVSKNIMPMSELSFISVILYFSANFYCMKEKVLQSTNHRLCI